MKLGGRDPKTIPAVTFIDQFGATIGGGQRILLECMRVAREHGLRIHLLAPLGGELESEVRARFGSVIDLQHLPELALAVGKKRKRDLARLALTPGDLLHHRATLSHSSLVYVNGPRWIPGWLTLNAVLRRPTILHLHLVHSASERVLISAAARLPSTWVVAASQFILDTLSLPGGSQRVRVVTNGLTQSLSRTRFSWRAGPVRAAVIGRIASGKGQHLVVELARKHPEVKFHVIGDHDFSEPDYARQLRSNAPSNVIFDGKVRDLAAHLDQNEINVSLVPSVVEEGFGLVAIESMAMSCLTLVRNRGGLKEIAARTGALAFERDDELDPRFEEILARSDSQRSALAQAQHRATLAEYGHGRFDQQLGALFDELCPTTPEEAARRGAGTRYSS